MYEAAFLIAIVVGLAIGTYFVAQSPAFWAGLVSHVFKGLAPIITKRMTPEQEAAWRDCQRRGGRWDPVKKRCDKWR